jgi:two-component system chemotaxis response regulator CheV
MDRPDNAVLEAIDERSLLSASNCMEILLFSLGTGETFGINVFKVREVCRTPLITRTPNMPAGVEGLISLRGNVIPVLSLAKIMGLARPGEPRGNAMMVTEYSKRTLGFLVQDVDRIIRVQWDKVRTPENISSAVHNFITALSEQPDGKLVSILDVETILANTFGEGVVRSNIPPLGVDHEVNVFYVDDSAVARRKITEVLDKLGVRHKHAQNGLEAWTRLESMARHASHSGRPLRDDVDLILTDAEMPEMDGYVLTRNIKADKRFEGIPVVMHSSLSSEANRAMGKRAGVDAYVAKFDAEALADTLRPLLLRGH